MLTSTALIPTPSATHNTSTGRSLNRGGANYVRNVLEVRQKLITEALKVDCSPIGAEGASGVRQSYSADGSMRQLRDDHAIVTRQGYGKKALGMAQKPTVAVAFLEATTKLCAASAILDLQTESGPWGNPDHWLSKD